MIPTREEAMEFIRDGLACNLGPWGRHCLTAAHCAEKIAHACGDMDSEKAYILGLLHDIGRKFGVRHLGHVSDGYIYMKQSGYDEVAKICHIPLTIIQLMIILENLMFPMRSYGS